MKQIPPRKDFSKSGRDEQFLHEEATLSKLGFVTNDLVRIAGRRLAKVNGKDVKLGDHAFTVLVLLAEHGIKSPGGYVSMDGLLLAIGNSKRRLGELGMSWVEPTPAAVYRAVCQLRSALTAVGLDESVIDSGRGLGYRLNTPATNILIDPALGISTGSGEEPGKPGGNRLSQRNFRGEIGGIVAPPE
jgi:DNA-binding winged helix-turn-helix (wHTH) protein